MKPQSGYLTGRRASKLDYSLRISNVPRIHRLTRSDFDRMSKLHPKRTHGRLFSLSFVRDPLAEDVKAACVISKKTAARASDRNRVRRRCREILRARLPSVVRGAMLLLYAKKDAVKASFSDMKADIEKLLKIS